MEMNYDDIVTEYKDKADEPVTAAVHQLLAKRAGKLGAVETHLKGDEVMHLDMKDLHTAMDQEAWAWFGHI